MRGGKRWLAGVIVVLLALAAAGWLGRDRLRAWYCLRGLSRANEADRARWIERVAALGEPALDGLVDRLASGDNLASHNAALALEHLVRSWGADDPRTADLAQRQARAFARLAPGARTNLLRRMTDWFATSRPSVEVTQVCARLLVETAETADIETQEAALDLAATLLRQTPGLDATRAARELARAALRSPQDSNRLRAVRLSLHPGIDLLEQVVALLNDSSPEVRRAAVLAVGPAEQVVREEGLLPGLHDPDPEVRRLTEAALRGRGLRPEHLELGRLLTHPQATMRLRVLDQLREATDLDPGLWLRRLSHDASPAVRAAAVRVMSAQTLIDLSDRIDQMARSDPSPTVAQLARYYLVQKPTPPVER